MYLLVVYTTGLHFPMYNKFSPCAHSVTAVVRREINVHGMESWVITSGNAAARQNKQDVLTVEYVSHVPRKCG